MVNSTPCSARIGCCWGPPPQATHTHTFNNTFTPRPPLPPCTYNPPAIHHSYSRAESSPPQPGFHRRSWCVRAERAVCHLAARFNNSSPSSPRTVEISSSVQSSVPARVQYPDARARVLLLLLPAPYAQCTDCVCVVISVCDHL